MSIFSKEPNPTDVTVVVNGSLMNVYDNLYKVLSNLEHSIEYANYDERVIKFKTSMTLTDWGFSFSVTLKPQGENQTQLSFYGLHLGEAEGRDPRNVGNKRVTQILNALNEMSTNIREEASSEPKITQQGITQNATMNNSNESKGFDWGDFLMQMLAVIILIGIGIGVVVLIDNVRGSSSSYSQSSSSSSSSNSQSDYGGYTSYSRKDYSWIYGRWRCQYPGDTMILTISSNNDIKVVDSYGRVLRGTYKVENGIIFAKWNDGTGVYLSLDFDNREILFRNGYSFHRY